jgi:hypothetical protein
MDRILSSCVRLSSIRSKESQGFRPVAGIGRTREKSTPAWGEFGAQLAKDIVKYEDVVKRSGEKLG